MIFDSIVAPDGARFACASHGRHPHRVPRARRLSVRSRVHMASTGACAPGVCARSTVCSRS